MQTLKYYPGLDGVMNSSFEALAIPLVGPKQAVWLDKTNQISSLLLFPIHFNVWLYNVESWDVLYTNNDNLLITFHSEVRWMADLIIVSLKYSW